MFTNKNFILASTSKSRYKILKNNHLKFVVKKPTCDEETIKKKLILAKKTPHYVVRRLAKEKAMSVSALNPNKLVVGCDTIIIFNNKIINKAKNIKKAKEKIKKLSGKEHIITSAISVYKNRKETWTCLQETKIKLRRLKNSEISFYLKKTGIKILSSAGCYQIELLGPHIIESVNGDFFNVMGFPLFPFLKFLKRQK